MFLLRFRIVFAALILLPFAARAQAQQPRPPERVIINFIAPVTTDTVNMLINIVNNQVRNGTKKITIVVSSSGGDPSAAFAAYNYLRNVKAEITTFNGGTVDSAAMFIFCAGKFRYSLPSPSRFLMHALSQSYDSFGAY